MRAASVVKAVACPPEIPGCLAKVIVTPLEMVACTLTQPACRPAVEYVMVWIGMGNMLCWL